MGNLQHPKTTKPNMERSAYDPNTVIETKEKKRSKRIWAWLAVLAVLAGLIIMMVIDPNPEIRIEWTDAQPDVFHKDGEVYIAHGSHVIRLDGAVIFERGADVLVGMRYAFYATEPDEQTGRFTLMAKRFVGTYEPPVYIADDVSKAKLTSEGQRITYSVGADGEQYVFTPGKGSLALHDDKDTAAYLDKDGNLYQRNGSKMQAIASNVVRYGVSPGGKSVYYLQETDDAYALFVKVGYESAEYVDEIEYAEYFDVHLMRFGEDGEWFSDDGKLCYSLGWERNYAVCVYTPQNGLQKITDSGEVLHMYAPDELVLHSYNDLYYKAPDEQKDRICEDNLCVFFPSSRYSDIDTDQHRFLAVAKADNYDAVSLYEIELGQDARFLTDADFLSFDFDIKFSWLAYTHSGTLYLLHKTDEGWSKAQVISDADGIQIRTTTAFDVEGKYFYYCVDTEQGDKVGDLYRYDLAEGQTKRLLRNVAFFTLIEDVPYAITTDAALYRTDTGDMLIQGAQRIQRADGGLYIWLGDKQYDYTGKSRYDVVYYDKRTGEHVDILTDTDSIFQAMQLKARPAPSEQLLAELSDIYSAAEHCLSLLDDSAQVKENAMLWTQMRKRIDALLEAEDTPKNAQGLLRDYGLAFLYAEIIAGNSDAVPEGVVLPDMQTMVETAVRILEEAMDNHVELFGKDGIKPDA